MKKRITLLFLTLLGCYFSFGAERVAPAFPEFVSLQNGRDYYLYNVGAEKFLTAQIGNGYAFMDKTGMRTTINSLNNGAYTITSCLTEKPLYNWNPQIAVDRDFTERRSSWSIIPSDENSYTIQIAPNANDYDPLHFVGCQTESLELGSQYSAEEAYIEWKLIDGDAGDMYFARLNLFNALESMKDLPYNIDKFEAVYADKESTVEQINEAATILNNGRDLTSQYNFPEWNDFNILFEPSTEGNWELSYNTVIESNILETKATLSATVIINEDATLCFNLSQIYYGKLNLKIDGKYIRSWENEQISRKNYSRYFHELTPGKHIIEWEKLSGYISISDIGIEKTPLITVNLLEPGSLGTEILYNVDHVKDVRRLKINGNMNEEDWKIIDMMKGNLFTLDMRETNIERITSQRFSGYNGEWPYLHAVLLPESLKAIENGAFENSLLDSINFPSSLEAIEDYAFLNTNIKKAILPEKCINLGTGIFRGCAFLEETKLSEQLTEIPSEMYRDCYPLKTFKLPSQLTIIGAAAFENCYKTAFDLPESLTAIESRAFWATNQNGQKNNLIIPKNVSMIGEDAFANCTLYTYAEMPVGFYQVTEKRILPTSIKTLRLNCPTVVKHPSAIIDDNVKQNVTLQVPSFLVNSYKLDEYWYEFAAIEGFETDEINEWVLNSDLVLGARERLAGTPNIKINSIGSLKINGTDGMSINDLTIEIDPDNNVYGRIFSNADGVTTNGNLWMDFRAGTSNKWYFLSLPYNVKVSEIIFTNNNPRRAIRYYDGANRAANGASGSWKNFAEDDIIPAGTGFIFQVSEGGWWRIPTQVDESKEYLTSNKMFVKALAENNSNNASDKGWNLVGNPYQCWYNIHKLNFTAPITVRENDNYAAYSVIDDDYAIAPNQAFFVQCPEGIHEISFPLDGRQMTSVIESQTGIKPFDPASSNARLLTDITVSNGNHSDRTRIVLNSHASTGYESNCDASKFLTEVPEVPQIYSYDNECQYAINERPQADGLVHLGFIAGESGHYTLSLTRNASEHVWLTDLENGQTIDLTTQDYGFTSEAGTFNERFELRFTGNTTYIQSQERQTFNVTAVIGGIEISGISGNVGVYNMAGVQVAEQKLSGTSTFIALPKGVYVVKNSQTKIKVIVL